MTSDGLTYTVFSLGDTTLTGVWKLAPGVEIEILDGTRALVRVSDGVAIISVCGGDGVYDMVQDDGEYSTLADGESMTVNSVANVYLVLDLSSGKFQISGMSADPNALVYLDVEQPTTNAVVCDSAQCWGVAGATQLSGSEATIPAGCASVRCWTK
jgi:hypothetical protein